MQRKIYGSPFQLRSGSPFKNDKKRMYIDEGDKNRLVDVTKGGTTTTPAERGTNTSYDTAWEKNFKIVDGMRVDKYGNKYTDDLAGKNAYIAAAEDYWSKKKTVVKEPDKVEDVPNTKTTETKTDGSMMDTFTPQDTRMAIRDFKINKNRYNKKVGKFNRKTSRYDKNLAKAGYMPGMSKPSEFTTDAEGNEVPNMDYDNQLKAYERNEQIKYNFDNSPKGKRLLKHMGPDSALSNEISMYKSGMERARMGAEQGVNPNKGRMIEYGEQEDVMTKAGNQSNTVSSDVTYIEDTGDLEEYTGDDYETNLSGGSPMKFNRHYGGSPFKLNSPFSKKKCKK